MPRPARPELLGLLARVKDAPEDRAAWLVLTDWLEEYGDESDRARAEYCRLWLERLGRKSTASDWENVQRRRELFRTHRDAWMGPLARLHVRLGSNTFPVAARHGMLAVSVTGEELLALASEMPEEIWAWVDPLVITFLTDRELVRIAACPLLRGPTRIGIQHQDIWTVPERGIQALAQSPYLGAVRRLDFETQSAYYPAYRGVDFSWDRVFEPLEKRFGERVVIE